MKIQRWSVDHIGTLHKFDGGDLVLFDDHAAELRTLRLANRRLREALDWLVRDLLNRASGVSDKLRNCQCADCRDWRKRRDALLKGGGK